MHQWWGDNVSEGDYHLTYFKEGLAAFSEFLYGARLAQQASGAGAFQASLVSAFNRFYKLRHKFWTVAPSNPQAFGLFSGSNTYLRPGIGYIALRQILGHADFTSALEQIQHTYGGSSITEPQLEAAFAAWLPVQSSACQARLGDFFSQWWDTAYAPGGGANRPIITGPGLDGTNFYGRACKRS
jgi:aminopeptidase N